MGKSHQSLNLQPPHSALPFPPVCLWTDQQFIKLFPLSHTHTHTTSHTHHPTHTHTPTHLLFPSSPAQPHVIGTPERQLPTQVGSKHHVVQACIVFRSA